MKLGLTLKTPVLLTDKGGMGNVYAKKRQFPRRSFHHKVGLLFKGVFFIHEAGSIGEGGLSVDVADLELTVGDNVILNFEIPNGRMIAVRAEVRNAFSSKSGNTNYGFKFEDLPFIEKRKIRTFVSARSASDEEVA